MTWADQLDVMASLAQPLDQVAKGNGHAIDFRWEGFADQGDVQGWGAHKASFSGLDCAAMTY